MSKRKPEVGDVWKRNETLYYVYEIRKNPIFTLVHYLSESYFDSEDLEIFVRHYEYVGKSKVKFNDLFEVRND